MLISYLKNEHGAIAIETALFLPILMWGMLKAMDVGLDIMTLQKMNNSVKSGVQFIVKGGRDETAVKTIVVNSFGSGVSAGNVDVQGFCACVSSSDGGQGDSSQQVTAENGVYVKTPVPFQANMCLLASCDSSNAVKELVNVTLNYEGKGVIGRTNLSFDLQTRVN